MKFGDRPSSLWTGTTTEMRAVSIGIPAYPSTSVTRSTERTASSVSGSLGSGAVTAAGLAVQQGLAAVVGVIIARELGTTAETDGFFAAYGVFLVLAIAATAARIVLLPPARACARGAPTRGKPSGSPQP